MKIYAIIGLMLIALVISVTLSAVFGAHAKETRAEGGVYGAAAYMD